MNNFISCVVLNRPELFEFPHLQNAIQDECEMSVNTMSVKDECEYHSTSYFMWFCSSTLTVVFTWEVKFAKRLFSIISIRFYCFYLLFFNFTIYLLYSFVEFRYFLPIFVFIIIWAFYYLIWAFVCYFACVLIDFKFLRWISLNIIIKKFTLYFKFNLLQTFCSCVYVILLWNNWTQFTICFISI